MTANYKCPTCGATKKIVVNPERCGNLAARFPPFVPCGWRDCMDYATRIGRR